MTNLLRRHRLHPLYWTEPIFWSAHSIVWDRVNSTAEYQEGLETMRRLLREHARKPGERVLDLGCGTGNYSLALAREGFAVVGLDAAPAMLIRSRAKADREKGLDTTFQWADFNARLPCADASFDHAVCIAALQCVLDPEAFLREIARVVKPGGCVVVVYRDTALVEHRPLREDAWRDAGAWRLLRWAKQHAAQSSWVTRYSSAEVEQLATNIAYDVERTLPFYRHTSATVLRRR